MTTALSTTTEAQAPVIAGFGSSTSFDFMLRQAQMLASTDLVPEQFSAAKAKDATERNRKIANTMIALEMANRIGASPFAVMQNIYIVHGKPSWSSTFVIAAINGCGRFSAMAFEMTGEGDSRTCVAYATEKLTGNRLDSPPVSIAMAKKEGWYSKNGSKWQTMPELMLRYRAATLFGRLFAPEILMGMRAVEELEDVEPATITGTTATDVMSRFKPEPEQPGTVTAAAEESQTSDDTQDTALNDFQQHVFKQLQKLAELKGETADDMIDTLTSGRIGCQQDLLDKPIPFLRDVALMIDNALAEVEQ